MKPPVNFDRAIASQAVQPRHLPIQWKSSQKQEIPLGPATWVQLQCSPSRPQAQEAATVRQPHPALVLWLRLNAVITAVCLIVSSLALHAYERLQGPTEVLFWNKTNTCNGYTFFGARSNTYLIDMEGQVVHTWPVGTNPHLLTNGHVLDAAGGDVNGFTGLKEVDWNGNTVWQYTETRANYAPHHDFLRIYNAKLSTNTTLYIAAKSVTSNQCLAAGCNPANSSYANAQVDAIVEVDMAGNVVWEWCFFDHGIQDCDASKSNYIGAGRSISNYPGRLNLNLPGRPLSNDWLHCNAIDYNTNLDQIVITAAGGEFYVIDHGNTFLAGNPAASMALAASTNGDFLYRFGDPARYSQGSPPSITPNWTVSTTGNKQIGAASDAQWIPAGMPGAGHFLVYNNGGDFFETTPQSYIFEINGYLNANTNDTGAYVNPPTANYYTWSAPGHDTDKQKKSMSRQITWMYYSMANQGMFSHLDSGIQRLPNGNTLVCDSTEGHIFEVTTNGAAVWEYINPVTADGIISYKRDNWPMYNSVFRAYRYAANHPALVGRTLLAQSTITGNKPSYISAPTISGATNTPAVPSSNEVVSVSATITNSLNVASATLTYVVSNTTNTVAMTHTGSFYSAAIPAQATGTLVRYSLSAVDDFGNITTYPSGAPTSTLSYTVYQSVIASGAVLTQRVSGLQFTEGPAADAAGNIYFSDVTADIIYKWSLANQLSVFRTNSGGANGLKFDGSGNLLVCEGDNGRLVSITPQTNLVVLTSTYGGLRYNEPNDLWIDPAGGVYFTDPVYFGHAVVQGGEYVYYLKPDRSSVIRVVTDMVRPNGLVGTSDGTTLYVADWGASMVYRYSINSDGTLTSKTAFASVKCDGMTMDTEGHIYLTENAVLVYDSTGQQVEQISIVPRPTNLAFGGSDRKTLFITTDDGSLYSLQMRVQGVPLNGVTNQAPVITNITRFPTTPTSADPVTVAALVTDDIGVGSVTLAYSIGSGTAVTNTVFAETMTTNAVKPWTGTGCANAWTVTYTGPNPFEQRSGANYGGGNTNGLEFKNGTANLTDAMVSPTGTINASGTSGFVEFYLTANSQSGTAGWTFQLNTGAGFITRLSELTGTNHAWQLYHYDLLSSELVSNLAMRFQFCGGLSTNRIDLDQITVKVGSGGTVSSNLAMSLGSQSVYTAQIPAQLPGTTVSYSITAVDTLGLNTIVGTGNSFSYVVQDAALVLAARFTPKYVRISGGSYVMGDHFNFYDPDHPSDEIPLHNVYISPLYMATTLTTMTEYCAFLNSALAQGLIEVRSNMVYAVGGTNIYFYTHGANAYSFIQYANNTFSVMNNRNLRPVTSVRWFGAIAFCNWLSQSNGFDPCYNLATGDVNFTNNGFRLPTEAEWEYCAHGGLTNPYCMFPWGTNSNADGTYANWEGSGDPFESSSDYPNTTPVGFYNGALRYATNYNWPGSQTSYQTSDGSNPFGLYDMGGNVWEWVNDWYASAYYAYCTNNNIVTNPPGPVTGDIFASYGNVAYRGLRGGTWWNGGGQQFYGYSRVSNRDPSWSLGPTPDGNADTAWFQVGFRVMRPEKLTQTVGLFLNAANACPGYTLMSPMQGTNAYLLNNAGQCVHKWTSQYCPGRADYLLENGHYIRECSVQTMLSTGGGEGGRHEERDWEGNLVWAFDLNTSTNMSHHDFKVLPNGNLIMIVCEKKTLAEVIAAGFNTNLLQPSVLTDGFLLPDYIAEVQPTRPYGGKIVWEWHAWDHLIQDYDPARNNYGVVGNNAGLINVNPPTGQNQQFWNHMNAIDYNPQFDQIMLSVRGNSELWVIDHSTTTAQAAGHTGGTFGKGGDLLYRWGNPVQYKLGTAANEMLWQQHGCLWIPTNCPGAGHILIFNNGNGGRGYTSVDEIVPPVNAYGNYSRTAGAAFGPASLYWTYTNNPATNFYCSDIGGAEREPNGTTLITHGTHGTLFEVTTNGTTVWSYVNPETSAPLAQGSAIPPDAHMAGQWYNEVFKVHRYAADYAGFAGKDLTPRGTIEIYAGAATDTVGLGLPDIWVRSHFGSLSAVTTNSSHSGNGLTDLQEFQYGLNPLVWSSATNGIPDGWAIKYGFDPTLAGTAFLTASNGDTLLQCYQADLNPTNAASLLAITRFSVISQDVHLTWIGGSNAWQYLECSTALASNQWITIFTNAPPTAITNSVIHTGAAAAANLFYRINAHR